MGRTPKGDDARNRPLPVKVSANEIKRLRARAVAAGMSLANYVRYMLLLGER